MTTTGRRARNAESTRALLVDVAREAFATQGYAATTIDDLLAAADVAKGALYHHFAAKEDLLRAVAIEVQAELDERIERAQRRTLDSWSRVDLGCEALLDACLDPAVQRILLLDYPAVVGSSAGAALAPVVARLRRDIGTAAEVGGNPCRIPLDPLAHMLCGAIQEGALRIAASPHPRKERRAVGETTGFLLTAIRAQLQAC